MKKNIIIALVLVSTVFSGCLVLSLYPIYTKDTLLKIDGLEGAWMQNDSTTWTFKLDTLSLYKVVIDEKNRKISTSITDSTTTSDTSWGYQSVNEFTAGLTKINSVLFLDLFPEQINDSSFLHSNHFIYGHSISKLKLSADTMLITFLEYEWINELNAKDKKSIGYMESEKNKIISAPTKAIRKFLGKYATDTSAFPEKDNYMIKVKK